MSMSHVSRLTALGLVASLFSAGSAVGQVIEFSDDFEDVSGSSSTRDDTGEISSSGSQVNTYGGFTGTQGTGQIVISELANIGTGGGGGISMEIQTLDQTDDTTAFQFLGFTYQDSDIPSLTPGAVAASDLATLTVTFDYKTDLAGDYTFRAEVSGGDFTNRLDLGTLASTAGVFQQASFTLGSGDLTQLDNLAGAISGDNSNTLQLVFGNGNSDDYQNGSTLTIDNIVITNVPEPGSFALLSLGAVALVRRRK